MADADLPDAEATGPLKPIRPPSPQKTNSNTHNAVEDGAMAHSGSVKRVRSLDEDGEEQDPTSNSASSPKRARLNDDDQTTNCKDPNVNNKDHSNEDAAVSSNGDDSSSNKKEEHLNSNGDLDGTDSPADQSKDSSKAPSIDGANDAGESKVVEDKDENSQNSTVDGDSKPKNGPPSEPSKEAEAVSLDADKEAPSSDTDKDVASSEKDKEAASSDKDKEAASSDKDKEAPSSDKDKEASESSVNSTPTESNSEDRTASPGNDKLCDSNAKENDTDGSKQEGDKDESSIKEGDKEEEEKMEVDGEDAKDSKQDSAKPTNGVDSIDKEEDKMDTTAKEESEEKLKDGKKEDDIIVLSDDNKDATNQSDNSSRPLTPIPEPSNPLDNLSEEQVKARDELIKKLNEELRNEEAKLLLLKKLRQSQQQPVVAEPKPDTSSDDPVKLIGQNHNAAPPPLVHGPGSLKPQLSSQASELVRQQRLMPQLIRGGNLQQAHGLHGNIQGGPPPLVLARGGNLGTLHQQQQHQRNQMMRMITTGNITHTTSSTLNSAQHARVSSTSNSVQETQSAASRQAAAKLALRKQLEKTLLQIPPPKPPPPELHFLPSAANNEFIILVGLEEVVNTILDIEQKDKSKKEPKYIAPFRCAQCKTDFTTIWKQGSKQGIMCENCIVSNQKKALKAEHTNRLKTAFVKALQQEQEIEQRMQQSHSAASSGTSLNIPRVTHKVRQVPQAHSSHQSLLQSAAHHGVQVIQQPNQRQRVLNPAPPQRTMQPVTYAYIPQVGGVNIAGIQMIPKQQFVTGHPAMVTATDRQREYLLDMISNKSGSSLSSMSWKR